MTGLAGPAGPWGLGFSGRPFRPTVLGAPGPGFVPTRCPTNVAHPEGSFFSKKNFSTYPMNVETEPTSGSARLDLRGGRTFSLRYGASEAGGNWAQSSGWGG